MTCRYSILAKTALIVLVVALWCVALNNAMDGRYGVPSLGDRNSTKIFVDSRQMFSRWFLSVGVISTGWHGVVKSGLANSFMPDWVRAFTGYHVILMASLLLAASIFALCRYRFNPAVVMVILSPVYVVYAIGYDEIYPFVVAGLIPYLAYAFLERSHNPVVLGAVSGAVALSYIGCIPLTFAVLLLSLRSGWEGLAKAAISYGVTLCLLVVMVSGDNVLNFLVSLSADSNIFPAGGGASHGYNPSDVSGCMWTWAKAFGAENVRYVSSCFGIACAPAIAALLCVAGAWVARGGRLRIGLSGAVLLCACLYYVLLAYRLIPLLRLYRFVNPIGDPKRNWVDGDFYTVSYVLVAFAAGCCVHYAAEHFRGRAEE